METAVLSKGLAILILSAIVFLYIMPLVICVLITIATLFRSFFRDISINKYHEHYVYPMNIGEFLKRMFWSFIPVINIMLVLDFVSKYKFYKKFGNMISYLLEKKATYFVFNE